MVNDGSRDQTPPILDELCAQVERLRVVTHETNRGYGGALRSGFERREGADLLHRRRRASTIPPRWTLLWAKMTDDVDWVNGWKISRADPLHRIVIGRVYHHMVKLLFGLTVRDVDCDFRLMRRRIFDVVRSRRTAASSAWR